MKVILKLVQQALQPLLYVGGGAVLANARNELLSFAERFQLPVTTTLMGKGAFPENHHLYLGMLGMHGTAYANFAVSECDLLIALGARFDDRVTGKLEDFAAQAQIFQIDIDPAEVGKNKIPHLAILGDIKKVLQQLLKQSSNLANFNLMQTQSWKKKILEWKKTYPLIIPKSKKFTRYLNLFKKLKLSFELFFEIFPQEIISKISEILPNAFFTTDVGQHQMWAAQFLSCESRKWLSSAGLGTMGYGLPAAIGAQIAYPKSTVICISGDASFQMNLQELGTIAQYELPIKILILNNKWQGMVRQWQESFYNERYSHSSMLYGSPNFIALANSYGLKAFKIEKMEDFLKKINEIFYTSECVLLDLQIPKNENCYPMVAPGKSNSQMIGLKNQKRSSNENIKIKL